MGSKIIDGVMVSGKIPFELYRRARVIAAMMDIGIADVYRMAVQSFVEKNSYE